MRLSTYCFDAFGISVLHPQARIIMHFGNDLPLLVPRENLKADEVGEIDKSRKTVTNW